MQNMLGYPLTFEEDGSFFTEDVIAGKYEVEIALQRKDLHLLAQKDFRLLREALDNPPAVARTKIVVPEITDANRNEPLDLGTLELEANPKAEQ